MFGALLLERSKMHVRTSPAIAPVRSCTWMLLTMLALSAAEAQAAEGSYRVITVTAANETVTLTGNDLTADQVVRIARDGAKLVLSPAAKKRAALTHGLMLQAAAEGVPVYLFNRGAGSNRERVTFSGDPLSAENRPKLEAQTLAQFQRGAGAGAGPEVSDEDVVRAQMVVRANGLTYEAGSPALLDALVGLINARITPVVRTLGGTGEADGPYNSNINGAMVGTGEVYYKGERMAAAEALKRAGLKPLKPEPGDGTVTTTNAFVTGQAALLVHDARALLEWADIVYAMDLNGMNSSITPLLAPVQANRPFKWLNWEAGRVLGALKGSYLFQDDPARIIQDPESLRASAIRQGSAWQSWGDLNAVVQTQLNHSDHNPVVALDVAPGSAPGLDSPYAMKFRIKGGPNSEGHGGYVFSNANWDWYPIANSIENFTSALANMGVAVALRTDRFSNSFFTVVRPEAVFSPEELAVAAPGGQIKLVTDAWQELQALAVPVTPSGMAIVSTVEDLQGQGRMKVARARAAVDVTFNLLAQDMLTAASWMELRRKQNASRSFGQAPDAALKALREVIPAGRPIDPAVPVALKTYEFLKSTPASRFLPLADLPKD